MCNTFYVESDKIFISKVTICNVYKFSYLADTFTQNDLQNNRSNQNQQKNNNMQIK